MKKMLSLLLSAILLLSLGAAASGEAAEPEMLHVCDENNNERCLATNADGTRFLIWQNHHPEHNMWVQDADGGNRQDLHEVIRKASMEATARMKQGEPCCLPALLGADPDFPFSEQEILAQLDPRAFTGRCAEQVTAYLAKLRPLLSDVEKENVEINV